MVRYLIDKEIIESFVTVVPVASTKAEVITSAIVKQMKINILNITNLVAVSFDDASNMSAAHGVQALLRQISPGLLLVHCRSHVLQLAVVKAASTVPVVDRTLNMLNKLYTVFHGSSKRLLMQKEIQLALDVVNHKLVQPGETR